jgi:hypothetical protein
MAGSSTMLILTSFFVTEYALWFVAMEGIVTLLFSAEILMQMLVQGNAFFNGWWGVIECAMWTLCVLSYMEVLARRFTGMSPYSHFDDTIPVATYERIEEFILLLRYAAQAGRVFVFMQEQPMNDSIDLASPLTRDSYDRPGNALSSFLDRKFSGGRFDEAWMCEKLQNSIGASFDSYLEFQT